MVWCRLECREIGWSGVNWNGVGWDGMEWRGVGWSHWSGVGWGGERERRRGERKDAHEIPERG